ncbi:exopolysaccharide biosynthesis protein [Chenggangzhangella methanolivorans]|uniref:Exopolysaccharide biosynthesis protein n=1 Tax=Chenggangzhangella methanolivorans TaxID=1437009 RepID=A0A9E6RBY9_9HYPH|nr:exopolysaccharide biosynthesis protein [Chenggangzhangella methanolivorans]QZO00504.1 exopolysaccharide biosynthesis protein [Chenggangzhangella methanolivorans]
MTDIAIRPNAMARTSDLLRNILLANPNVEVFTVGQILDSLGADRTEASLVFFSMPSIVPAPDLPSMSGLSTGMLAGQMIAGRKTTSLPKAVLNKKVPRRSLAVAIHALAPVIEAAEKISKPRLRWATCPLARRVLGLLLFILAVAIAFPVIGFDPLHAASISVISLGLAEQDGLAILLGVMAGVISLVLIATSGLTAKILKSKIAKWLRKLARKAGAGALPHVREARLDASGFDAPLRVAGDAALVGSGAPRRRASRARAGRAEARAFGRTPARRRASSRSPRQIRPVRGAPIQILADGVK